MAARFLILCLVCFLPACDKPLRLPYITPELHHWPKPYKGVAGLRLHVFNTGTVEVPSKLVYRADSLLDTHTLDILVFVIEHPRQGLILVGTGLNRKMTKHPERYLGPLLASLGNPAMEKGQDIVSQLKRAKLPDEKVRHLILPDLRLDHTGELESYPAAQAIAAATEHNLATDQEGTGLYLAKEYDNVHEWRFIDFVGAQPLGTFRAHRDLFGDGSVLLLDAAGATAGGLAVLVRLPAAPVLLCGNLAWTKEHYFHARLPGLLSDRQAWWEKIWRLKKFADLAPELIVLPDHDWAAAETVKNKDIILHPFSAKEAVETAVKKPAENKKKKEARGKGRRQQTTRKTRKPGR